MNRISLEERGVPQNSVQTEKIQAVLDEASAQNAAVVIPKGIYMAGTLNLGCASLYLEKGAVLRASPDMKDYRSNGYVHNEMRETISFLYSRGHEDIVISGEGMIDLNGEAFYDMAAANVPDYGVVFTEAQKAECTRPIGPRPTQPLFFEGCCHVTVRDIRIIGAPCWTMSFHGCEDVRITDLTIENSLIIPNNDGMHFCGCRDVFVRGCNITAGDDCIALSGITDWDRPCENVVISQCILRSVSKAISIGYMHSIVRNVTISDCLILDSQRGVCVMSSKGTGLVEHLLVRDCVIDTNVRAGNWWGNGEAIELLGLPHSYDGYLRPAPAKRFDVSIRDVRLQGLSITSENVIAIVGDEDIEDVTLAGFSFEKKESTNRYLKGDRRIDVSPSAADVLLPPDGEYWLYVSGCRDLRITDARIKPFKGEPLLEYRN